MKKRTALFSIIIACLLLLIVSAQAETGTNPYRGEMLESLRLAKQKMAEADSGIEPNYSVTINMSKASPKPGDTVTFSLKVTGVDDPTPYNYEWGIIDRTRGDRYMYFNGRLDSLYGITSIKYKFWYPGKYWVYVKVNQDNNYYYYKEFTIADNGTTTLEKKAQSIVSSCRGSTQWETALNLYDWLTEHVYYDSTYQYYGEDMLFNGYGVCDGFSRSYRLLCQTAGIDAEVVENPDHAWNAIKLGGNWYQADPTWDAGGSYPPGEGTKKDGKEGHTFFCLPASVMQKISAHIEISSGPHAGQCTSMAANYYVHENLWQDWGGYFWDYSTESYVTNTWLDQISSAFLSGNDTFEFSFDGYPYHDVNGTAQYVQIGYPLIVQAVLQYGIPREPIYVYNDRIKVTAAKSGTNGITVKLTGWNRTLSGTLKLPLELKTVPAGAFESIDSEVVVVRTKCESIGSRAFANSGVRIITIPAAVTSIASDAFAGCGPIIVKTPAGSAAETFALNHNMLIIHP